MDVFDFSDERKSIFGYLIKLTSFKDLDKLLEFIVHETPELLKNRRCSIYLTPEFVPQFDGNLLNADGKKIKYSDIDSEIIVLAQTNYLTKKDYLGKIFYPIGADLTGWVFKYGQPLRISDARNPEEVQKIDSNLFPSKRYIGMFEESNNYEKRPILFVPLITLNKKTIGVIKFHKPINQDFFDENTENIVKIIAQVLSSQIEKVQIIRDQVDLIYQMDSLGSKSDMDSVYGYVTENLLHLLSSYSFCEIYIRNPLTGQTEIHFQNGKKVSNNQIDEINNGILKWIFQTGKYLYGYNYDKKEDLIKGLNFLSDNPSIFDDYPLPEYISENKAERIPNQFYAIPLTNDDGYVFGILCIHSAIKNEKNYQFHPQTDYEIIKVMSRVIEKTKRNSRIEERKEFLLTLSEYSDIDRVLKFIKEKIPLIIPTSQCFIVQMNEGNPISAFPKTDEFIENHNYELAKLCSLSKQIILISHYGTGITKRIFEQKLFGINARYPNDLVIPLRNTNYEQVGIFQAREGEKNSRGTKEKLLSIAKSIIFEDGKESYLHKQTKAFSYCYVPICDTEKNFGVIIVNRFLAGMPFSNNDIQFLKSIANILVVFLTNKFLLEQRQELLISLSHEINTLIVGILFDLEVIKDGSISQKRLLDYYNHISFTADMLQMTAETITGTIFLNKREKEFRRENVYAILKKAIDMFQLEAKANGSIIQGPKLEGEFPKIQMKVYELTTAFKNIIHNAIKYSYSPAKSEKRYIKIFCRWKDEKKEIFVIEIQNYGVQIDPDEKERIFEKFYRGINAHEHRRTGMGIGLYYAKRIIEELHQGRIWVESKSFLPHGNITTFFVELPINHKFILSSAVNNEKEDSLD